MDILKRARCNGVGACRTTIAMYAVTERDTRVRFCHVEFGAFRVERAVFFLHFPFSIFHFVFPNSDFLNTLTPRRKLATQQL